MPPPCGAGRKDTCPYLNLPVFAESGSPNLDAPPTGRAKDVGGNRPPRTPMGPEPLFGSTGSGGCTKSRSRRHTHKDFTQLRAARMRKTLLLLVWIDSSSCSGAQEATVSLGLNVGGCLLGVLPFYVAWASFYMLKGLPTGSDAGEGKNVNKLC